MDLILASFMTCTFVGICRQGGDGTGKEMGVRFLANPKHSFSAVTTAQTEGPIDYLVRSCTYNKQIKQARSKDSGILSSLALSSLPFGYHDSQHCVFKIQIYLLIIYLTVLITAVVFQAPIISSPSRGDYSTGKTSTKRCKRRAQRAAQSPWRRRSGR